ncbi:MAG: radical SAM protein [Theionarchaea archaeon]|nr:radical SAM protein [Theionarchaea archaeon]
MRKKHSLAYGIARAKLQGIPYKLNYAVTYRCNARCEICSIWKKYQLSPQTQGEEMTLEDIDLIFRDFDLSWLSLTGGEPFLRDDLVAITTSAERHNNHLALLTLPTNGLLPLRVAQTIEQILEETTIPNIFCSVSLDGDQSLHDKLRGVEGTFEKAKTCYELLKNIEEENDRFCVFIEFTLSQFNAGVLLDALKSFGVTDFSRVIVTAAHSSHFYGTSFRCLHTTTSPDQIDVFLSCCRHAGIENLIPHIYTRLLKKYLTGNLSSLRCVSGRSSFFLDPYGILYPCITMDTPFGNLKESPLSTLLQTQRSKSIVKKIREGKCPGCWTPCEAYQAILEGFPRALKLSMST